MKYRQIVFDVDGTLIDTEYAVLRSLRDTVEETDGRDIPIRELSFALGIPGEDALRSLRIGDVPAALSLWDRNLEKYQDTIAVFDGIEAMLRVLAASQVGLGIVTSKTRPEYKTDFLRFAIASYFETVICADDTAEHKPGPAPLLKYMERTGCRPGELLYVGDSVYDRECAQRAGVEFGLAGWGAGGRVTAARSFDTPADLVRQLLGADSR